MHCYTLFLKDIIFGIRYVLKINVTNDTTDVTVTIFYAMEEIIGIPTKTLIENNNKVRLLSFYIKTLSF